MKYKRNRWIMNIIEGVLISRLLLEIFRNRADLKRSRNFLGRHPWWITYLVTFAGWREVVILGTLMSLCFDQHDRQ